MKLTAQIFKEAREKQKLTISEVSAATKINSRIIEAIEEGNRDKLPATTFLKGFLRTYARHLHLDEEMVMDTFHEESPDPRSPSYKVKVTPKKESDSENANLYKRNSTTVRTLAVVGICLLIVVIVGVKRLVEKYERESFVAPTPDLEPLAPVVETDDEMSTPEEDSAPVSSEVQEEEEAALKAAKTKKQEEEQEAEAVRKAVEAKKQEEAAEVARKAAEAKKQEEAAEVARKAAEAKKQKEAAEVARKAAEAKKQEEAAEAARKTAEAKKDEEEQERDTTQVKNASEGVPQEIIVEALDSTRVRYSFDGQTFEAKDLKPNQIHIIRGRSKIKVVLQNAGSVRIVYNGIDKGVPGDLGKSMTLTYP